MNFEQKYKVALEKLQDALAPTDGCEISGLTRNCIEEIFPELAKSVDERIRKEIIDYIKTGTYKKDWIAWLEKQGEHKPIIDVPSRQLILSIWMLGNEWKELTNGCSSTEYGTQLSYIQKHWHESEYYLKEKQGEQEEPQVYEIEEGKIITYSETDGYKVVEPKFKVGDWVIGANNVYKIIALNDELNCYIAVTINNEEIKIPYYFDDAQGHICSYHLWSIEDAKDGDVLAFDNSHIILVKESHNSTWGWRLSCWCHLLDGEFEVVEYHTKVEGLHPATKEQRDLLFQKMKDDGYEWDAEKKKLEKKAEMKGQ